DPGLKGVNSIPANSTLFLKSVLNNNRTQCLCFSSITISASAKKPISTLFSFVYLPRCKFLNSNSLPSYTNETKSFDSGVCRAIASSLLHAAIIIQLNSNKNCLTIFSIFFYCYYDKYNNLCSIETNL